MTQDQLNNCYSYSDICRYLNVAINGKNLKKAKELAKNLDITHFDTHRKHRKYNMKEKICPVCNTKFTFKESSRKDKETCSHACSNTHFRSGVNNPNWKESRYRTTCFAYHKQECIICKEQNIVEVHHYDEDNKNNKPENLIPLCPTHHQYWHSRYKSLIEQKVQEYIEQWKSKRATTALHPDYQ
jgi:hypothetical protein